MIPDSKKHEEMLRQRLQSLNPTELEIFNESHLHNGHKAYNNGLSHFRVQIASPLFADLSRVEQQRLVLDAVKDIIPDPIHALAIRTEVST
ncbi:BolA family protein [Taylorella equigenitalis]|uniref:BolA-like protein n=3 Tax=Taylorella equigenitalis TaxID=29575 RepID=A0A654KHR6_TAYEM|nr:BolA family protein [Taylorella equigenitalis]ADU91997.1 BolA-like protein [Taylorella equigenitalis MCE9]AFN35560.1 BolA-like protein [Taylorella equigenitalis ATCC 35865]ASY30215.1 BolA family transcriptional regulator [Taylorella equigenitalis]ASY37518.1 BolA family transcriptional regulator [Taylorella equigenitalis]ASY38987.1 BolA family transcriptional regulator [Taylorella equigenitalis]